MGPPIRDRSWQKLLELRYASKSAFRRVTLPSGLIWQGPTEAAETNAVHGSAWAIRRAADEESHITKQG